MTVCLDRCVINILRLYLIVRFLFTFLEIVVMSIKLVLISRFTWNSCSPNDPGEFRECFPPSLDQTQQTIRSALVLKVTSSHASSRIGICSSVRLCSCNARKKWHVAVVLVCAPNTVNNTKTMLTEESIEEKILAQSKTTKQGRTEPYDRLYILFCTHKKPLRVMGKSELRQQYWEGF